MGLSLQISRLAKAYQSVPVLRDCSFSFAAGGSYILMGPNGSGKSTLLRIAALLETPDQGEVRYFDGPAPLAPDVHLRRRLTMVFPRVGVFNTTVYGNVAYGLRLRGLDRREARERVKRVLAEVGLSQKAEQRALTLSSGETMRLGLARALVIEPQVLFLDEPTTSLDPANAEIVENCLHRLRKPRDLTLVLVTHDLAQAGRLGGQILRLQDGRIQAA